MAARRCGTWLIALLLSACSLPDMQPDTTKPGPPTRTLRWQPPRAPSVEDGMSLAEVLEFVNAMHDMPVKQLLEQRLELERRMLGNPDDQTRLKLALLLGEPRMPERDVKHARTLLEQVLTQAEPSPQGGLVALVTLIQHGWSEHDRQQRTRRGIETRLTRERERRLATERLVESAQWELERELERRRELEQQVKALKAIEQHMRQRDAGGKSKPLP